MKNLIITHGGKAHFDEFFAISLVLAVYKDTRFTIERRNPASSELDNPDIWVIDIGNRHDEAFKNFDHHQNLDMSVSFVLVADYLGLTETLQTAPWWKFKDRIDRYGPTAMAREIGVPTLQPTHSPLEEWIIGEFEKDPNAMQTLMASFARSIITKARVITARMGYWKTCQTDRIKDKIVLVARTSETLGLREYSDSLETPVDISITYDNRGKGWRLRRINENCGVNFSRLENCREISFAHKGGFIAKTRERLPLKKVYQMVVDAMD
jgi:hypothetical protein